MKRSIGFEGERFVHINSEELKRNKYSSLLNDLYIHSIGYYHSADHHFVDRPNGASEYIMIYCIDGGGSVKIEEEKFHLEQDQLVIIPPKTPHAYYADNNKPWSIYWVHFLGNNADFFAESFRYPVNIAQGDNSRIEYRKDLFEEIFNVLNTGDDLSHMHYANSCFVHFMATIKYLNIYRRAGLNSRKSYGDKMIQRLIHYMNENVDKQLSNSDFARFIGYSESYLYRCFFKETGVAPSKYFLTLKIKKACVLLGETNLLVKHIAMKLGFNDPFYFSKMFCKEMGVTPSEYRINRSLI